MYINRIRLLQLCRWKRRYVRIKRSSIYFYWMTNYLLVDFLLIFHLLFSSAIVKGCSPERSIWKCLSSSLRVLSVASSSKTHDDPTKLLYSPSSFNPPPPTSIMASDVDTRFDDITISEPVSSWRQRRPPMKPLLISFECRLSLIPPQSKINYGPKREHITL